MKKAAFLSMDSLEGFESYDHLLFEPFNKIGWKAELVSWRADVDWKNYDVVIIRSPWDYLLYPDEFLAVLEKINQVTHLENNIEIVKWNLNKNYLGDLEEKEVLIVPTIFETNFSREKLPGYFRRFNAEQIIIKPNVSAGAYNTFWLTKNNLKSHISNLKSAFNPHPFMVQPFMTSILSEGEYSLFYFGGKYSHTILKTPKDKDFRVQEEHGGKLTLVEPEPLMKKRSEEILSHIEYDLLYARIDFVRTEENDFALIELELIEPSLYFNMDPESPERFTKVFERWYREKYLYDN